MGVVDERHSPAALPPLYGRLGGPQGQFERERKISPPPGFDSRTVAVRSELLYRLSYPNPHFNASKGKGFPLQA